MNGYLSIADAAKAAGLDRRALLKFLKRKHRELGGVLFRIGTGNNSKYWTTPAALKRIMPERFEEVTEFDLADLHLTLRGVSRRTEALEKRLRAGMKAR